MKTPVTFPFMRRFILCSILMFNVLLPAIVPSARAGLTVDVHLYHDNFGYYFYPYLNANTDLPGFPDGIYQIASPQIPANGSRLVYVASNNTLSFGYDGDYGCDFDTYAIFGNDILAAPFYDTVQSLGSLAPGAYIPGQTCVAKFDRNGNPLWARLAESQSSFLNSRDIALAADGLWSCGFFNQQSVFGTITINGGITVVGSPIGTLVYHPSGYLAKITDGVAVALPVTLLNPLNSGANFQFQFLSQSGFTHNILYRTNLTVGNWLTNSMVIGNGTVTNISLPYSLFSPARQGFIRVSTQ